jgi:haloalkane dehalogenase
MPDRFAGLVLGNTFAWPPTDVKGMRYFSQFAGGPIGKFLIRQFNAFVTLGMARSAGAGKKVSESVMNAYKGPFPTKDSRYPTYVFPRELRKSRPFFDKVSSNLERLNHLPVLLTWGDADPLLTMENFGRRFQETFPKHETIIMKGVGHFFQEEAPDVVSEAIRSWHKDRVQKSM